MRRFTRWVLPSSAALATTVTLVAVAIPAAGADPDPVPLPVPASAFVVGDDSAIVNQQVSFWGAQWWKESVISSGETHASFKGWATEIDNVNCTFTTRPGNSPPPPDGPLPDVMLVAVTTSVTKSGPVISGSIQRYAVVETNPGYDDNPGHEGTGKVVGFQPCGPGSDGGGGF
jgi:hypothetical protein